MDGDAESFWALVGPHERTIYAATLGVLGIHDRALEATQETMLRAWSSLSSLRSPEEVSSWLYMLARQVSLEVQRRSERANRGGKRREAEITSVPDLLIREDEFRMLEKSLEALPEAHRTVLAMKYLQGLRAPAIAEVLGIKPEEARARLIEARKNLRRRLEGSHAPAKEENP